VFIAVLLLTVAPLLLAGRTLLSERLATIEADERGHVQLAIRLLDKELFEIAGDLAVTTGSSAVVGFALDPSRTSRRDASGYLARIARSYGRYPVIQILDVHGRELFRFHHSESASKLAPEGELGDLSDQPFVQAALALRADQVHLSEHRGALTLLLGVFFSYFATGFLGTTPGGSGFIMASGAGAYVASALSAGLLAKRFGELCIMLVGAAVSAVGLASTGTFVTEPRLLAVCLTALGIGWAMLMLPGYPLITNQGGKVRIGFYTGMYYLFAASASVFSPAVACRQGVVTRRARRGSALQRRSSPTLVGSGTLGGVLAALGAAP
jgi:hypothetical protein